MAALISLSLWCIWLSVLIPRSAASQDPITAKPGENVTLTCRAPNSNILVVEWRKAGLKEEYVLLYRDGHLYPDDQLSSFKNRVELQDRQMKDGDVSLILKNVTAADDGAYECRVITRGANRRKRSNLDGDPIRVITLSVVPPGQPGGHTEDGGKEDEVSRGHPGLIVGLIVFAALLVVVVGVFWGVYRKRKEQQSQDPYQPAAKQQPFRNVSELVL